MRVSISFQNPKTGEIKPVKLGFSWTLFFFSALFGLPLFMRKLSTWGWIMLVLMLAHLLFTGTPSQWTPDLIAFGLSIWLAIKGNEMTAKNYLELGWVLVDPDNVFSKLALQRWGIAMMHNQPMQNDESAPQPAQSAAPASFTFNSITGKSAPNPTGTFLTAAGVVGFLILAMSYENQHPSTGQATHNTTRKSCDT